MGRQALRIETTIILNSPKLTFIIVILFSFPQFDSSQQKQTTDDLIQLLSSRILTTVALISRHPEQEGTCLKQATITSVFLSSETWAYSAALL